MEDKLYSVRQITLASGLGVVHQTRSGTSVTLHSDKPCAMSEDEARTFLIDPDAFEVRDNKDNIVLAPSQKTDTGGGVRLDADEVIAKLHELTAEALHNRCLRLPGNTLKKTSKKDALIEALLNAPKEQANIARGSEGITPEINTNGIGFKSTDEMLADVTVVGQ